MSLVMESPAAKPAKAPALPGGSHRDIVEQQMISLRQEDDKACDHAIIVCNHADRPCGNPCFVVVEHWAGRHPDARDIDRVSSAYDFLDDRTIFSGR